MKNVSDAQLNILIKDAFLSLGKSPYRSITSSGSVIDQAEIVFAIIKSFLEDKRYVILRAPVGSGKSIIAAVTSIVINELTPHEEGQKSPPISLLTTPTKILTDQYSDTFNNDPSIVVVKGAESFKCDLDGDDSTGADCINFTGETSGAFNKCVGCAYLNQRRQLMSKQTSIVVATSHYVLTKLGKSNKGFGRQINLIVYDEAHLISDIYSSTFGIDLTSTKLDKLVTDLKDLTKDAILNKKEPPVNAIEIIESLNKIKPTLFANYHTDSIRKEILALKEFVSNISLQSNLLTKAGKSAEAEEIPEYTKKLGKVSKRLNNLIQACLLPVDYAEGYVNIDNSNKITADASWTISPVTPGTDGWGRVDSSKFTLFMSGTLDIDLLAVQLGIDPSKLDIIDVPYSWDKMLKPVVTFRSNAYLNFTSLAKGSEVSIRLYKDIAKIARFHQVQRESGIIITTSYAMSSEICSELTRLNIDHINHTKGTEGIDSIAAYTNRVNENKPTVLVIPAMFEGFDGVHDLCRYVIIPKTPFANTQGPRSKALLERYPELYAGETVNKLVQGFGRGVRKSDDWCIYYLMDKTVIRILNNLDPQYKAQFERVDLGQPKDIVDFKHQFNKYLEGV